MTGRGVIGALLLPLLGGSAGPSLDAAPRVDGPVAAPVRAAEAPAAAGAALDGWIARLEPAGDELAWRELPWRASLWQGLVDAAREGKPLLLWVMNGHPLGCT